MVRGTAKKTRWKGKTGRGLENVGVGVAWKTNLRTGKFIRLIHGTTGLVLISNGRTMKAGEFKKCNITEYINAR